MNLLKMLWYLVLTIIYQYILKNVEIVFFIILGKLANGDIKDSVGESEKSLVSITKSKTKVYLSLHNNVNNSYWHVNKTDLHVSRS